MPISRNPQQQRERADVNNNDTSSSPTIPVTSLAGRVVWIPSGKDDKAITHLPAGSLNHPAVVLSPCLLNEQVVILVMTSFNSTDLAEKYPNGAKVRAEYLPIHPSPPHPDTREILHLRDGMTLRKKSYLKISVQHTVRFDTLRPYDRTRPADYFLEATSYQKLVRLSGFDAVAAQAQAYLAAPQIAPQHRRMGLASVQPLTEPMTPVRPLIARQPAEILEARYYGTVPKRTLPDPVPSRSRPGPRAGPGGMTYLEIFHYCAPTLAKLLILGLMGTGVYAAWVGRAQLGQLMVQLLKWCAAHAAWLVKTMLKGLWYGMGWLLKSLWGIVRGVAGGLWRWLRTRSGTGEVVVRWWTR